MIVVITTEKSVKAERSSANTCLDVIATLEQNIENITRPRKNLNFISA